MLFEDPGVILVVEDPFIRKFLRCALTRAGFTSVELEVEAAREFVRSGESPVKALITNQPAAFHEFAHHIHLVYTTSCPDPEALRDFDHARILQKPFHAGQLLEALQEWPASVIR